MPLFWQPGTNPLQLHPFARTRDLAVALVPAEYISDPYGVCLLGSQMPTTPGRGGNRLRSRRLGWDRLKAAPGRVVALAGSAGAARTGLSRLIGLELLNSAADAAVAVALAGTIFFQTPTDQARPEVARFLALTMAPLAILAPFIGPFLDRFRHGRRWALGITAALRAFLAWVLASQLASHLDGHGSGHGAAQVLFFVCALGVLVANKAYAVSRAAAVPRLLPFELTLVSANARIAIANVVGLAIGGGLGAALAKLGPSWPLRLAFVFFIAATVLSSLLPRRVDSTRGENAIGFTFLQFWRHGYDDASRRLRRFRSMTAKLQRALLATIGARLMSGFLTFFLAFLFRLHPIGGLPTLLALSIVVVASGAGSAIGTVAGNLLRDKRPELIAVAVLGLDAAIAVLTTVLYSGPTVVVMGFVAGLSSRLARLGYDALVQGDVAEAVRTSVFGRSEAVFQMVWVAGGFLGIALPLMPRLGFGVISALLISILVLIAVHAVIHRRRLGRLTLPARPDSAS